MSRFSTIRRTSCAFALIQYSSTQVSEHQVSRPFGTSS